MLLAAGLCAFTAITFTAFAVGPTVSNVRASQRAGTQLVDVYYDLADPDSSALTVSVAVSTNGGASYTPGAASFTGALGVGIAPGSNKKNYLERRGGPARQVVLQCAGERHQHWGTRRSMNAAT